MSHHATESNLPENDRSRVPLPHQHIFYKHCKHHCGPPKGGVHWNIDTTNRLHGD